MEIARALTKRYKPHEGPHAGENGVTSPNRSISSRRPHKDSNASSLAINRAKISLPIELLSTTNVLAYNAPDIYPQQAQHQQQQHQQQNLGDHVSSPVVSIPESVPSTASSSASTRSYDDSASDHDGSTTGTALTAASSITTTPDYSREGSPAATFPDINKQQHQHGSHHHQLREYFGRVGSPTSPGSGVISPIDNVERTGFDNKQQQQQQQQEQQQQQQQQQQPQPPSKLDTKDIPIVVDTLPTPQSPAPLVPTRALSHTKKTHQALARRRSRSRTSDPAHANANAGAFRGSGSSSSGGFTRDLAHVPPPLSPATTVSTVNSSTLSLPNSTSPTTPPASTNSNANSTATTTHRSSQEMFAARAPASASASAHPFGAELAQVKELAEEFCGSSRGDDTVRVWSEEEQFLTDHGLRKFGVEDYLCEILPLFAGVFEDDVALAAEGLHGRFSDGKENKNGGANANANASSSGYYGAGSRKDRKEHRGRDKEQRQRGMTTPTMTMTTRNEADGRDRAAECFAGGTAWF